LSLLNEHIDEIIAKVICNEATRDEQQFLSDWIQESDDNAKYFRQMKSLMHPSDSSAVVLTFDTDAAWAKVQKQISSKQKVVSMLPNARTVLSWRIAAVAIVIIGLGALVNLMLKEASPTFAFSTTDVIRRDSLPDGSHSTLNTMSSLSFAMTDKKRTATLKGEAFFEVKHDDEVEFVVETQDVFIRDIGTAFNVKSHESEDSIIVYVKEGEVSFYSKKDDGVLLHAGEKGVYVKSKKAFFKTEVEDQNVSSYADKEFRFRNTSMRQVIKRLKEVYGDKIILSDSTLEKCRITVNFENDEIETIAMVIAETMGWKVAESDGVYQLIGEGCNE